MKKALVLVGALTALYFPAVSQAACRWEFDCSTGPCRRVQLCDSTMDMPVIQPPAVAPIAPPSIAPIATPTLPPLGTTSCQPMQICNNYGQCQWQTVCR